MVWSENYSRNMDHHRNPPICDDWGDNSGKYKPYTDISQCNRFPYIDHLNLIPVDPLNLGIIGVILVHNCKKNHKYSEVKDLLEEKLKLIVKQFLDIEYLVKLQLSQGDLLYGKNICWFL